MPTGYTYPILKGITFPEFALQCSRAFGALMSLRDDPMDAPIPDEFLPSDYYLIELKKAQQDLERYASMSLEEAEAERKASYEKECENILEYQQKTDAENAAFRNMLKCVEAWEPPTDDHKGLKKFMIEQIEMSITPNYPREPLVRTDVQYRFYAYQDAIRRAERAQTAHNEEVKRCAERTAWVQALKRSLIAEPV